MKPALDAPAATVTAAGTVTAALSLVRLTTNPPLGAAALNVTVHASGADPIIALLVQFSALKVAVFTGAPVPFSLICIVGPPVELLVIVSWPVAAPVADGLNCRLILNVLSALTVTGTLAGPLVEKDCPDTANWVISTGAAL